MMKISFKPPQFCLAILLLEAFPAIALSEGMNSFAGYNSYGYPGLIDMPSALARPDAELAYTTSHFRNQTRNTLTFQITPRLSGSFRYSALNKIRPYVFDDPVAHRLDRSFSLHYKLRREQGALPALAIGLNDFLGTGMYSSEYVVATKALTSTLRVTGGIGWGRLAGVGSFRNPLSHISDRFDTRPGRPEDDVGGNVRTNNWFRGPAALFAGVEWQASERLQVVAEYSSDAYPNEDRTAFNYRAPFNFGLRYQANQNLGLDLRYFYGSEIGFGVTLSLNPRLAQNGAGSGLGPAPVVPRVALGWTEGHNDAEALQDQIRAGFAQDGLRLHGVRQAGNTVRVEFENLSYPNTAQAIGRAARRLTGILPRNVETITLVVLRNDLAGAAATLQRSDLEALEHHINANQEGLKRAEFAATRRNAPVDPVRYPLFDWGLKPYISTSLFDPDSPFRADVGAELFGRFEPAPGLIFAGVLRKPLVGNLDSSTRPSTSVLPHVRSDFNIYERQGDPAITELTAAYFFQPGKHIYGRVTLGYLEPMFAGVSGELLWKPIDSRVALGVDMNYVKQRAFAQGFGVRDYEIATGHASVYWDIGNGFHSQLDAGRYLAGDWGATFILDREFNNGWKVGAFATITDVSASDFGEGSFDKGLRFTVPLAWVSGKPRQDSYQTTIRPVTRDGGARLDLSERLYGKVRDTHLAGLKYGWGRFWK